MFWRSLEEATTSFGDDGPAISGPDPDPVMALERRVAAQTGLPLPT